jgi:hypothetical protein
MIKLAIIEPSRDVNHRTIDIHPYTLPSMSRERRHKSSVVAPEIETSKSFQVPSSQSQ